MPQRIVVALGGNALQRQGETSAEAQKQVARSTAAQLAQLVKEGHELVIVHGNGPQVGTILLNEEQTPGGGAPLDTCVAMSQGQIGYWLQQALTNELAAQGITMPVVTVVTQTVVDSADPAFRQPTKPIGSFYPDEQTAKAAAPGRQIIVKEDAGRGWRRVVPSPQPVDIVERSFIGQAIVGTIVIACGGGGVPVIRKDGDYIGVEAVIDKDFAAEKLAELIAADLLLVVTGVDAVAIHFGTPQEQPLRSASPELLRTHITAGQFAPGSMLPKVEAAARFVESGAGRTAIITSPEQTLAALRGEQGTRIAAE